MNKSSLVKASLVACALGPLCLSGGGAQAQTFTNASVSAFANIFGAGNAANPTPNPGGGSGGAIAPEFDLTPGAGRVLTFSSVSGNISFTPGASTTPDGLSPGGTAPFNLSTDISSYQGISGIRLDKGSGFLTGVFLSGAAPADPAPARLLFTNDNAAGLLDVGFASLSPVLDQTFFIGDGLAGNGSGTPQDFVVPSGATRLFLGYADGNNYSGDPGQYQDNSGSLTASFQVLAPVPEAPSAVSFGLLLALGLGGLVVAGKRKKAQRPALRGRAGRGRT